MKPSLYLLIPALFIVASGQQEIAAQQFPAESLEVPAPVVTDASRMVVRNGIVYDVNSNSPFTGVFSHPETGLATFKDGKYDGVREEYFEDGTLESRRIYTSEFV